MKKELGIILAFVILVVGICIAMVMYTRSVNKSNQEVEEYISIEDSSQSVEDKFAGYILYTDAEGNYYVIDYDITEHIIYGGQVSYLDVIPEFYEVCEAMEEQGFEGEVAIYPLGADDGSDSGGTGSELVYNYTGAASYYMCFYQADSDTVYDIIIDPEEGLLMEEWEEEG